MGVPAAIVYPTDTMAYVSKIAGWVGAWEFVIDGVTRDLENALNVRLPEDFWEDLLTKTEDPKCLDLAGLIRYVGDNWDTAVPADEDGNGSQDAKG